MMFSLQKALKISNLDFDRKRYGIGQEIGLGFPIVLQQLLAMAAVLLVCLSWKLYTKTPKRNSYVDL